MCYRFNVAHDWVYQNTEPLMKEPSHLKRDTTARLINSAWFQQDSSILGFVAINCAFVFLSTKEKPTTCVPCAPRTSPWVHRENECSAADWCDLRTYPPWVSKVGTRDAGTAGAKASLRIETQVRHTTIVCSSIRVPIFFALHTNTEYG